MRSFMTLLRLITLPVVIALGASTLAGCNTVHGAGQDISSAGHVVQHGARHVQHEMNE
ncbi:MAG TPA: entericidin A/B family lipoprotein [Dongiaceae bacterium]